MTAVGLFLTCMFLVSIALLAIVAKVIEMRWFDPDAYWDVTDDESEKD